MQNRTRPQKFQLQEGHVAFKVVCHKSLISGLIGSSGSVISKIRRQTSCHIHCDKLVQGSDHRVIHVAGSDTPERKIRLNDAVLEETVSAAQEGVIRILERMWELESGELENNEGSEGYCGLLSNTTQVGAVMGKGGKHIAGMRRFSGAHIVILPAPLCASKNEELIQITGAKLAVKKAVISVTTCLKECPAFAKDQRHVERPDRASYRDPHEELFPHLSSVLPALSENTQSLTPADVDLKDHTKEVCFRLLCSNGATGSIIGKRGSVVRALQNITGASILFDSTFNMSGERVVTVSALEDVNALFSPAQNAIVFVFARSVEYEIENGHSSGLTKGSSVTAKLLVESGVACCLSGNGERIDSEIVRVSGAEICVLEEEHVLESSRSEVVVQISGEYKNVQSALFLLTSRIRNLLSNDVANEVRKRDHYGIEREIASPTSQLSTGLCVDSDQEINLTMGIDRLEPRCPAFAKDQKVSRHMERPDRISYGDQHMELFPHLSSSLPPLSENTQSLTSADMDLKDHTKEVCFRLLCSNGATGSIIGKRGSVVRALQNIAGASIVFDSTFNLAGERVVTVSALEDVKALFSPAQNAIVLVFARSVEYEIESGRSSGLTKGSCVTAKLLVESVVAFCLSGNGERIDSEIVRVSGAEICVLEEEHVLESSRSEVVVQISGEYKNVQSALFLLTSRIRNLLSNDVANEVRKRDHYGIEREIASPTSQLSTGLSVDSDQEINLTMGIDRLELKCPAFAKDQKVSRHVERPDRVSYRDPHVELFPHLSSLLPPLSENTQSLASADVDLKDHTKEVCFRLLCSNGATGSIIGKRGSVVRALQNIAGASIVFDSTFNLAGERVVTVSALEDVKALFSPAQNAIVLVFARSVEYEIERGRSSGLTKGSCVTAKLLVESDVAFCLNGNGERIDSEILRVSGAEICVLEEEHVLEASRSEAVVQISGEYKNVQSALFLVTSRIRNLLSNDVANEARKKDHYVIEREIASPTSQLSAGLCLDSDQEIKLTTGIDRLGLSDHKIDPLTLPYPQQKLGTDYTPNGNDNGSNLNFVGATELERSLHFLLPREVLDEVGSRSSNGEVKETALSGLYLSLGLSSSNSSPSIQGHQTDLSGRIDYSAAGMWPLKDAGRGDIIANQGTEKESTTHERSGKPERKRSAIVASTTLELIVPDDLICSIYGEGGSNLENLRKISGAKVKVQDPSPGQSEGMVVISGTPDQTRMAESLIYAFI